MTYRPIASTETDPDSPVTATLMVALAENHLAVTQLESTAIDEGEVNAAQFYQHALVTTPGDTDALVYDHAVDGTVASIQFALGADKLTGFEYQLALNRISHNNGANAATEMRFFLETSAVWTSWLVVGSEAVAGTRLICGEIRFSILPTSPTIMGTSQVASLGIPASAPEQVAWEMTTTQNVTLAELRWSGGSIDAGEIYMLKRATYVGRE